MSGRSLPTTPTAVARPVCSFCPAEAQVLALTSEFAIVRLCERCFDAAMRQRRGNSYQVGRPEASTDTWRQH